MTAPLDRPPATTRGQQLPLPLGPPAAPAPALPAHQVWTGLPPAARARVRATFVLVAREVLHAADRR
jgi:hypothetical protein